MKVLMRLIKDKMTEQDNDEFATELFNDRNQPNGNKLRIYRLYKENVNAEQFVLSNIPRSVRRTMALRSGWISLHFNIDMNFCSMDKQSKLTIKRFAFCINSNWMSE
jgi:hypothetical protein